MPQVQYLQEACGSATMSQNPPEGNEGNGSPQSPNEYSLLLPREILTDEGANGVERNFRGLPQRWWWACSGFFLGSASSASPAKGNAFNTDTEVGLFLSILTRRLSQLR